MSEQPEQDAPDLGPSTDVENVGKGMEVGSDETTIDTPDELGGTGGQQSGGAG